MSEPANPDPFEMLPDLGAERPDFEEPWQGEALALVVSLHRAGYFEWREWVGALSTEIAHDAASTSERPYYQQWLAAIEKLLAAKELVADGERETRKRAGKESAINDMIEEAQELGADAVVGVDLDYETIGERMLMVSANGTAVKFG